MRMLVVGLDAADKTTISYKLKLAELVMTIPIKGFNVEKVMRENISFMVWDFGGQYRVLPLWKYYFQGAQGLIFVVNSNGSGRIG